MKNKREVCKVFFIHETPILVYEVQNVLYVNWESLAAFLNLPQTFPCRLIKNMDEFASFYKFRPHIQYGINYNLTPYILKFSGREDLIVPFRTLVCAIPIKIKKKNEEEEEIRQKLIPIIRAETEQKFLKLLERL